MVISIQKELYTKRSDTVFVGRIFQKSMFHLSFWCFKNHLNTTVFAPFIASSFKQSVFKLWLGILQFITPPLLKNFDIEKVTNIMILKGKFHFWK